MEIMIPVWREATRAVEGGAGLDTLAGARVAFVDDNLDTDFTEEVEAGLARDYQALIRRLVKPLGTAPSPQALLEEAATCQVALVGVAL
jgi:hypothetical protein